MTNEPLVIERTFNAPADKVWAALTSKEAMKIWSFDVSGFEPVVGYEFTFDGCTAAGTTYHHISVVTEVIPGKKLSYTWRYEGFEGISTVTYELFPEGDKTRLRLTHAGIETIAVNGPDFAREQFHSGWTEIIGSLLKKYLEETKS